MLLALEEWRHWLEGAVQPFIVWTDHQNLIYLQSAKWLNPRQSRWALFRGFQFHPVLPPGFPQYQAQRLVPHLHHGGEQIRPSSDPAFILFCCHCYLFLSHRSDKPRHYNQTQVTVQLTVCLSMTLSAIRSCSGYIPTALPVIKASPRRFHSSVNTSGGPRWTQTPRHSSQLVQPGPVTRSLPSPGPGYSILYLSPAIHGHTLLWIL